MSNKPKVLISQPTSFKQFLTSMTEILTQNGFAVTERWTDTGIPKTELLELIADKVGFILGLDIVNENVLTVAKNLKVISKQGIGTDNIDIPAATRHGVVVCNTPGSNASSVADLTLGLMICLARKIITADATVRQSKLLPYIGPEFYGKTLGIIGLNNIGKQVARRAKAFGMKVIANDIKLDPDFAKVNDIAYVTKDQIYTQSDFITVHIPLTKDTMGMIGAREFNLMKAGCYVINTARGGIVNEEALADALRAGKIAGAGIDVFSIEPPSPDYVLFNAPNVIFSSHMGGSTPEAIIRAGKLAALNIVNIVNGRPPLNALNPVTLERYLTKK
jgi:D-3-phosphoglycerate dehydrogenase